MLLHTVHSQLHVVHFLTKRRLVWRLLDGLQDCCLLRTEKGALYRARTRNNCDRTTLTICLLPWALRRA